VKASPQMETLCEEIRNENLDDPKALPQKLLTLLSAGFVEEEQCVFLSVKKPTVPVHRRDFRDCTDYECYVNHIHIEDYLENGGLPPLEMLGRGIAFARELKYRLARLHGAKHSASSSPSTGFLAPFAFTQSGPTRNGWTKT